MPSFTTKSEETPKETPAESAEFKPVVKEKKEPEKKEPVIQPLTHIVCAACEKLKPVDDFYPASTSTGYQKRCKACEKDKRERLKRELKRSNEEDKIEFVNDMIAMLTVAPRQTGDWAGRDKIIRRTMSRYQIDREEADKIVIEATSRLFDERPDNPPRIERRLMLQRLNRMRDIIFQQLERSTVITEYEIKSVIDPATNRIKLDDAGAPMTYKIPKKMKRVRDADASLIKCYLEIEQQHAQLCGLDQAGERDSIIGELMEQFHLASVGNSSIQFNKNGGSLAKQIREKPVGELVDLQQKRLTKQIEVKVTDIEPHEPRQLEHSG